MKSENNQEEENILIKYQQEIEDFNESAEEVNEDFNMSESKQ